jgi:hypothetical protein
VGASVHLSVTTYVFEHGLPESFAYRAFGARGRYEEA